MQMRNYLKPRARERMPEEAEILQKLLGGTVTYVQLVCQYTTRRRRKAGSPWVSCIVLGEEAFIESTVNSISELYGGIITLKTTEAAMCEIYRMETQLKSIKSNPQFRRLYSKLQKRELIQENHMGRSN